MIEQEINIKDKKVPKHVIFVLQGIVRLTACLCLLQRQLMMGFERAEERVMKLKVSGTYQVEAKHWVLPQRPLEVSGLLGNLIKAAKPEDRARAVSSLTTRGMTPPSALKTAYASAKFLHISSYCIIRAIIYTKMRWPFWDKCISFFPSWLERQQARLPKGSMSSSKSLLTCPVSSPSITGYWVCHPTYC